MKNTNIFDPEHYVEVRRPLLEASTLPTWCYTSDEWYEREVQSVFLQAWHLVGREDEMPSPGDYLVFDLCGESAIVIRGDDGEIRALANTCRHRGTRLLNGSGHCRAIICPYHAWTYNRRGELWGLRGMEKTLNFDKADYGLLPVRLDSWAGFLFVCFSERTEGLAAWLGNLPEEFAPYRAENLVCTRRRHYDLDCNWKIYVENAMEDYHTPTVHKTSIGLQECDRIEATGQWDSIWAASERTLAVLPEETPPFPHTEGLSGRPAGGTYFTIIYPTSFLGSCQDTIWWLRTTPLGTRRMRVEIGSCFPKSTVARPDFEAGAALYYKRWDKALPEDNAISERQQVGLQSQSCRPGRLSSHEPIVHALDNWVLDRVLGLERELS